MEELPPRRRRRSADEGPRRRSSEGDGPRRKRPRPPEDRPRRRRRSAPNFEITYNRGWGIFGICFGGMVMMYGLCGGAGGGTYGAGMCCGGLFGLLMFGSGIYYTVRG